MKHGLLITDSTILKDMYRINFKTYLDLNCTIKSSLESAIHAIDQGLETDIIIVQAHIGQEDTALGIYNFLLAMDFEDIPIIVLGKSSRIPREALHYKIENVYEIKTIIQAIAKQLGITAKEMANKEVPQFFPIPLSIFSHLDSSEYDLFYNSPQKGFVKLISQGDSITPQKIKKYQKKGIDQLFIQAEYRLKFTNFFSKNIIQKLTDPRLSPEQRIENVQLGYAFIAEHIEEIESIEDLMEISRQCINSMNLIIEEEPKIKRLLENLFKNQTSYAFKHCQLIAFIAAHILNEIEWGTKEHIEKLSFVAFYHDILLSKEEMIKIKNTKELASNSKLSDKEKELVNTHAYRTSLIVQQLSRAPLGTDNIIKQHHGMISGVGFETGTFSNNLSPLAIIFIIAEYFSEEILANEEIVDGRPSYKNFDQFSVIQQMYQRFINFNYKRAIRPLEKLKL